MPSKKNSRPNRKKKKNSQRQKVKQGNRRPRRQPSSGGRPTLILKAKALVNQNISLVNVKQINIAPTVSIFGPDVL
jgi:hypothetical protein